MSSSELKFEVVSRKWGLAAALCTSPLFLVFAYFGDPGRGRAAWISAGIFLIVVRLFWGLRNHVWFWITIAIVALLHVLLVVLVPWSSRPLSYVALLPMGFLDSAIVYGSVKLAQTVSGRDQDR